jgi:hypothetical protein
VKVRITYRFQPRYGETVLIAAAARATNVLAVGFSQDF